MKNIYQIIILIIFLGFSFESFAQTGQDDNSYVTDVAKTSDPNNSQNSIYEGGLHDRAMNYRLDTNSTYVSNLENFYLTEQGASSFSISMHANGYRLFHVSFSNALTDQEVLDLIKPINPYASTIN